MALVQCDRCGKTFDLRNPSQRKWYIGKRNSDIYGLVNTCLLCDECHEQLVGFMEETEQDIEECERSFFDTLLAMLDDATIAQLDEISEYARRRAAVKRTEQSQLDMKRWKEEKEAGNDGT